MIKTSIEVLQAEDAIQFDKFLDASTMDARRPTFTLAGADATAPNLLE